MYCNGSYFSSPEKIAYFLIHETVHFLIHFKFLRVCDSICREPLNVAYNWLWRCLRIILYLKMEFYLGPVIRLPMGWFPWEVEDEPLENNSILREKICLNQLQNLLFSILGLYTWYRCKTKWWFDGQTVTSNSNE